MSPFGNALFNHFQYRLLVIGLGASILLCLFFINPPRDRIDNVYESRVFDHSKYARFQFSEVSDSVGVDYRHSAYKMDGKNTDEDLAIDPTTPSVSVIDVNHDGFMDFYVTTQRGVPNRLYINHEGKYFTDEAKRYGLDAMNEKETSVYALWGDFNNDGRLDLLLAYYGCHRLFVRQGETTFVERTELLNGYCSRPNGVNTADFLGRKKLDLVFANYLPPPGDNSFNVLWMTNSRYDNWSGGQNRLLSNGPNGFQVVESADFKTRSFTHNAGISDVNHDRKPDVFFANDYSQDQMFLNLGEGVFQDETNRRIPIRFHGHAGMNTEFFDYNLDGLIDLYVTNIFKPPFSRNINLLWQKNKDLNFENVSTSVGTAQCGFSWASKFFDADNDGQPDLLVMNGRARSPDVNSAAEGKSMWFERTEVAQLPKFLRGFYQPDDNMRGRFISAFERKCFFVQDQGQFYDVAESAGLADREENRGLALIDYDNDGRLDVITFGLTSKLKIYHNDSKIEEKNHWVGFSFSDKNGNPIPHGLSLSFELKNGKKIFREFYPANGYRGFNDPRMHVGLGPLARENEGLDFVDVYWPLSGLKKRYRNIKPDQYNLLVEDRSDETVP